MNSLDNRIEKPSNLLSLFEAICFLSCNDPTDVIKKISLSSRDVYDLKKNFVSIDVIDKICDFFELVPEDFIRFELNFDWISQKQLPEKYFNSLGSTIRTSLPPLRFIQRKYGEKCFNYILRKLKIPNDILKKPELSVSIELLADILSVSSDIGLQSSDFFMMGHEITKIKENKDLVRGFNNIKRADFVLEKLFSESIPKYESNFDYRILEINQTSVKIEVEAKKNRRFELGKEVIDNSFVNCHYQGIMTV